MSLMVDAGSVVSGKAITTTYTNVAKGTNNYVLSYANLQNIPTLFYSFNVTIGSSSQQTRSGQLGIGESASHDVNGVVCTMSYNGSQCTLTIATPQSASGTLKIGNTSSLNANTDVLLVEEAWSPFDYVAANSTEYTINLTSTQAISNPTGILSSPYWLPLKLHLTSTGPGGSYDKTFYWDFAYGHFTLAGSISGPYNPTDTNCFTVDWQNLQLIPHTVWPSSAGNTAHLYGSCWVAVCPFQKWAPPRLLIYNNKLIQCTAGTLLSLQRNYNYGTSGPISAEYTKYLNNCAPYPANDNTSYLGWSVSGDALSSMGFQTTPSWGSASILPFKNTGNGLAAPLPYWQTSQPAQGILADTTHRTLKSNNSCIAMRDGDYYAEYSDLIPVFIHAYDTYSESSIKWQVSAVNNPVVDSNTDQTTYINNGAIVGANENTGMMYAYNSDVNINSFTASSKKALQNAICGALHNNIILYVNDDRFCIKHNTGDTWQTQIDASSSDPFNFRAYGADLRLDSSGYILWNNRTLYYNSDVVYPTHSIVAGGHYTV